MGFVLLILKLLSLLLDAARWQNITKLNVAVVSRFGNATISNIGSKEGSNMPEVRIWFVIQECLLGQLWPSHS